MAEIIHVKNTGDPGMVELLPDDVSAVVIQDRNFFEAFSYTPYNGDQFFGFFKKIISGRMSLYRYNERLFVKKENDKIREVTRKTKHIEATVVADDYSGLGMLRTLIQDCPSMSEQTLLDYYTNEAGIKRIIHQYNSCFPEPSTEIIDIKVPSHVDLGVIASLNEGQPDFSKTFIEDAHFGWSTSIGGGIFLSLFTPTMGDKVRVVIEPSFGRYNGYSYFVNAQGANDLFIKYSYVRVPLLGRFFYKNLFFDIGTNNMIVVKDQTVWRQETQSGAGGKFISTFDGPAYKIKPALLGVTGGIGMKVNLGTIPLLTSIRASDIFYVSTKAASEQPGIKWLDLNIALQLTGH